MGGYRMASGAQRKLQGVTKLGNGGSPCRIADSVFHKNDEAKATVARRSATSALSWISLYSIRQLARWANLPGITSWNARVAGLHEGRQRDRGTAFMPYIREDSDYVNRLQRLLQATDVGD